MIDFTSL